MALALGLLLATLLAAEALGQRTEIYCGAAGGALVGLVGILFGARIAAKHRAAKTRKDGAWDVWALWGVGMLARLALLGVLALVFWKGLALDLPPAMLSLAAVYLVLLFWEAAWLHRILVQNNGRNGMKHG